VHGVAAVRVEKELGYRMPPIWAATVNSLVLLYGMHPEGIRRVAEVLRSTSNDNKRSES
jgi:hypothetical protein